MKFATRMLCLVALCATSAGAQDRTMEETKAPESFSSAPSITAHLQMKPKQIENLNRFHEQHAAQKQQRQSEIARLQIDLAQAQSPTSFDRDKATDILSQIHDARQQASGDLLLIRAQALKVLTSLQRSQLESLSNDRRINLPRDKSYQLLLMPLDAMWQVLTDNTAQTSPVNASRTAQRQRTRQQKARNAGSGTYGAYGGYAYGRPNYGVYAGYGVGGVGVQVGVGSGGPSIGIGIGKVFGGVFGGRRRY